MKTQGSIRDYGSGVKSNWRRAIWNEVLRRTDGREKTEPILYLAGPQDLDRKIAVQKGVNPQNLVAIDHYAANVQSVRKDGGLAIDGDALDVLWSWPEDRRVCAVLLDFCSGIQYRNASIYDVFERRPLSDAVIVVNFMRGRDPWSNSMRSALEAAGLLMPLWVQDKNGETVQIAEPANRAYQFLLNHALETVSVVMRGESLVPGPDGRAAITYVPPEHPDHQRFVVVVSLVLNRMRPKFYSYRSGHLVFDSAVFSHTLAGDHPSVFDSGLEEHYRELHGKHKQYRLPDLTRKIAATLAIRTRRLAG